MIIQKQESGQRQMSVFWMILGVYDVSAGGGGHQRPGGGRDL